MNNFGCSYAVTGRVVDGNKTIGIKVYELPTLNYRFIWKEDFAKFFTTFNILNLSYSRGSLVSKNDAIPVKFLRVFNKDGFIIKEGVYTESIILAAYLGVDADLVCLRVCGALVSGAITNLHSNEADAHADLYYAEIRARKDDVAKISRRTGFSFEDIRRIKNYLFLEQHDLGGGRVEQFDSDFAIAQSWQRLADINMEIKPHDITLINHELLEMNYVNRGYSRDMAHTLTSEVYDYDEEVKRYYDKIKRC